MRQIKKRWSITEVSDQVEQSSPSREYVLVPHECKTEIRCKYMLGNGGLRVTLQSCYRKYLKDGFFLILFLYRYLITIISWVLPSSCMCFIVSLFSGNVWHLECHKYDRGKLTLFINSLVSQTVGTFLWHVTSSCVSVWICSETSLRSGEPLWERILCKQVRSTSHFINHCF